MSNTSSEQNGSPRISRGDPNGLITVVASAATAIVVATAPDAWRSIEANLLEFLVFLVLTLGLQLVSVEVFSRGSHSFAGVGLLAVGFTFGVGPAAVTAALMGLVALVARRGRLNRGVFDAAQLSVAGVAGTAVYHALGGADLAVMGMFAALAAAGAFMVINFGLLCLAMSLAQGASPVGIWKESFRWRTPYTLASGPLAFALVVANEKVGMIGLIAFTLPPAMMMFSVRQYVSRTRKSVEDVRRANEELELRNADLRDLFEFAGGLAARAHDRDGLVTYVEESVRRLTGAPARVSTDPDGGVELVAGGKTVGSLELGQADGFDQARWERLSSAILPQLATAIESADLVSRVRRQHLATIAALSKSMEAKDYYTGGHTERVAEVAVALARRLDYRGAELDAIEIGALLHDIGKIGIPERILQKPGPLDDDEWKVMKEHPIISEYILSEVDLPPIVLEIARSSHERIDGDGYPDRKKADEIPLPARIVLVADAFDALTSDRPYRRGRHVLGAIHEIRAHSGTQFCPSVVRVLEDIYREEPHVLGTAQLRAVEVA